MLSAKLLSCLAVVSAIVMASCEAHAEVAEPDEGSKVLTSPGSAISQHDTTRSLRTSDAAVAKANEERVELTPVVAEAAEEAMIAPFHDISTAVRHNAAGLDNKIPRLLNDLYRHLDEINHANIVKADRELYMSKKLLSKEQGQLKAEFDEGLSKLQEEDLARDHGMSKEVADSYQKIQENGVKGERNMFAYLLERVLIEQRYQETKTSMPEFWFGEGLVANVDKSKAAAGAHAGTDHAAV